MTKFSFCFLLLQCVQGSSPKAFILMIDWHSEVVSNGKCCFYLCKFFVSFVSDNDMDTHFLSLEMLVEGIFYISLEWDYDYCSFIEFAILFLFGDNFHNFKNSFP